MDGWGELIALIIAVIIVVWMPYLIISKIKQLIDNKKRNINLARTNTDEDTYASLTDSELENIKHLASKPNQDYSNAYEPKYLMTLNEKTQYRKLQQWAKDKGLIVFSKVRLLDLITPRKNLQSYKSALWKIQAKHVDFLICDQNIKVKCIVEINDNSHNRKDRAERDAFVTEVLQACGYKVIQTYYITDTQLDEICGYSISSSE